MGYAAWRPAIDGIEHVVEVDTDFWSTAFEARVDGRVVGRRSRLAAFLPWKWGNAKVQFDLEGERATLVGTYFFRWTWVLYVGGKKIAYG